LAFSIVLFSMLLGTGLGSAFSARAFNDGRFTPAWFAIVAAIAALIGAMGLLPMLDEVGSLFARSACVAGMMGGTGFVLGFGFPLGVRLADPTGEWAIQKLWAVNGAATIAGSSFASIIGVMLGARAVLAAALLCYLIVMFCGIRAQSLREPTSIA
jgi:hypothetical protein